MARGYSGRLQPPSRWIISKSLGLRDLIPCDIAVGELRKRERRVKENMPCAQVLSELNIRMNVNEVHLRVRHQDEALIYQMLEYGCEDGYF